MSSGPARSPDQTERGVRLGSRESSMTVVRTLHGAGNVAAPTALLPEAPVDVLEADAWVIRGKIVLQHDRPVSAYPVGLHQRGVRFRAKPGSLEALLAAASGRVVSLDMRSWLNDPAPDVFRALDDLAAPMRASLRFTCESWSLAERLRAWLPDIPTAYSVRSEAQLRRFIEGRMADSISEVDVTLRHSLLHAPGEVEALRRFTPRIAVWTVDDLERARELASWGVDEVVSNRLEVLGGLQDPPHE